MDKYQKQVKEMPNEKIVAIAEGHSKATKFCWISGLLAGGGMIMLGLVLGTTWKNAGSISLFCILLGILLFLYFALIASNCKKWEVAAAAEVSARGLNYAVEALRAKKRAERKIMLPILAVFIAIALLIAIGLHSCGGNYTEPDKGYWGSDGYYNPSPDEMDDVWDDVNDWMDKNWD